MGKEIITDSYAGKTLKEETQERRKKGGFSGFDGATFIDERNNGMNVHIALTNSSASDKRIALFAGDLENVQEILKVAGVSVDAIAVEGAVITKTVDEVTTTEVECTADNLAYLQRYIRRNPSRISKMQLTADNHAQFNKKITVTKVCPFQGLGTQSFLPMTYKAPGDQSETMVVIDFKHLQVDDQTVMDVVIGAGRTLYVSIFFGASNNGAYTLDAQARELLGN
jgi:ureidoglycolate hydrolase